MLARFPVRAFRGTETRFGVGVASVIGVRFASVGPFCISRPRFSPGGVKTTAACSVLHSLSESSGARSKVGCVRGAWGGSSLAMATGSVEMRGFDIERSKDERMRGEGKGG